MPSANPALKDAVYRRAGTVESPSEAMTVHGSVIKSGVLVAMLLAAATFTWSQAAAGAPLTRGLLIGGLLGGFIVAMITILAPRVAPVTAPIYAVLEGLFLGAISAIFEGAYPGIVFNAVAVSIGVVALMLFAYGTGIIRVTDRFRMVVVGATGAILLVYVVSLIMSFFGMRMPLIHETGLMGIGFSVVVVIIAALNLLLDFDFIETGVQTQAPRSMEWYAGFALLVTLVWMYLEILRLLAKLRER